MAHRKWSEDAGRAPLEAARSARAGLVLLCAVSFIVIMDAQVVILALPPIRDALGFSEQGVQWVLTVYLLVFGGLLLLGGRVGDIVGHRRMLVVGSVAFAVTSSLCALATTPAFLVGARAGQGLAAALMAPCALALIAVNFPEGRSRNRALAAWSITGGFGATVALLIGGALATAIGWEWIFWVNLPIAGLVALYSPRLLREGRCRARTEETGQRFDLGGALSLTAGLGCLVFAVVDTPQSGWVSVRTGALLALGAVLLVGFVLIERRATSPVVDLSLLMSRVRSAGNAAMFLTGMSAWGLGIVTASYAQDVLGFSAIQFGLGTVAMTAAAVVGGIGAQRVIGRSGAARVAVAAGVCQVAGCGWLTQISPGGGYWTDLFGGLVFFGLGLGAATTAASVAALTGVVGHESGVASGLNTAAFQLGGAFGSAVVTSVIVGAVTSSTENTLGHGMVACTGFALAATAVAFLSGTRTGVEQRP